MYYLNGVNGPLAQRHVEEEAPQDQEQSPQQPHTEERNVVLPLNLRLATKEHAQLIVSWGLGLHGHHAQLHAEVVLVSEPERLKLLPHSVEKLVQQLKNLLHATLNNAQ